MTLISRKYRRPPWILVEASGFTCQRCRARTDLPRPEPFDGARSQREKRARRKFTKEHRGCLLPPRVSGLLAPGPSPEETWIDGGLTVRDIYGHAVIGGTHLSRLPASASGWRRNRQWGKRHP